MTNTITATGLVATTPRHLVTAEGLHLLSFRITEESGNDYVVHLRGPIAADNVATVTEGTRLTVAGSLVLHSWDTGAKQGVSPEIHAEWIGNGAGGDQFAEGAKYVLEDLSDLFSGVEHTDIWAEFFPEEEEDN